MRSTYDPKAPRRHEATHAPHAAFPVFIASLDGAITPCRHGPEWTSDDARHQRRAAELCQACQVLAECRTYSLLDPDVYGVAGGLTPENRAALYARQSA